jgi:hypothetical protein
MLEGGVSERQPNGIGLFIHPIGRCEQLFVIGTKLFQRRNPEGGLLIVIGGVGGGHSAGKEGDKSEHSEEQDQTDDPLK